MQEAFLKELYKMKTTKEQREVLQDAIKNSQCKQYLIVKPAYNAEIQNFINKTIDKYRNKKELKQYHIEDIKDDKTCKTQYYYLCLIDKILIDYSIIKCAEEKLKNG